MFGMDNAHHFRKMVAGFCMIVAPLLILIGMILHPERKSDASEQFGVVAANMDEWASAHVILFAGAVLAVPAILGLMHMLRERQVTFGHLGGGMALLGLMALAGVTGIEMALWQMAEGSRAEMVALLERMTDATAIVLPFFVMALFTGVGLAVLGFGLHRAEAVPTWAAASVGLAGIGLVVQALAYSSVIGVIAAALLLVGLGSTGWTVWRESDEAWEGTQGFSAA